MSSEIDIKKIEQKTYRDAQQDGMTEILMGICLAALAGRVYSIVFTFVLIFPFLLLGPVLQIIRKRFTYPRIGYVKLVDEKPRQLLTGIFLFMIALVVIFALAFIIFGDVRDWDMWMRWLPAWLGILLVGMFFSFVKKSGDSIHYVFAVLSLAGGLALSVIGFKSIHTGLMLYLLLMGLTLISYGLIKLILFRRRFPKSEKEVGHVINSQS
jgi:hypothetical protein